MRRIIDTYDCFDIQLPIDRQIPEPADVLRSLPRRAAKLAIQLMGCSEDYIRQHLRVGSTPPTKVSVTKSMFKQHVVQKAVYAEFHEMFICM